MNDPRVNLTGSIGVGKVYRETNVYILVDEDGNEIPAIVADEPFELTATTNDIRVGTVAVTEDGIVTGEKEIPSYYVNEGVRLIPAGGEFRLAISDWDYKKLQVLFCEFNKTIANSVFTDRISTDNAVYNVLSLDKLAQVVKDEENALIDFGIVNTSDKRYLLRYFMYKEIY